VAAPSDTSRSGGATRRPRRRLSHLPLHTLLFTFLIDLSGEVPVYDSYLWSIQVHDKVACAALNLDSLPTRAPIYGSGHTIAMIFAWDDVWSHLDENRTPVGDFALTSNENAIALDSETQETKWVFGRNGTGTGSGRLVLNINGGGLFTFDHWKNAEDRFETGTIGWTCVDKF